MPVITPERMQGRIDAIVDAATQVFSTKGFESASIAEIARAAGVSDGLIYRYFESKRDLLYRVLQAFYERLLPEVEAEVAQGRDFQDKLHRLVRRHFEVFVADRGLCRLFLSEVRVASDYQGSAFQELNRRYTKVLTALIENGIARGEVKRDVSPRLVRDVLFGAIEHLAWPHVNSDAKLDVKASAAAVSALFVSGVCSPQKV